MQGKVDPSLNLQHPRVSRSAVTFSRLVVAGRSVVTLALELAALAVAPGLAELLAAPALVPICTDTGTCDGVAEGLVLALAPVAAVGSPVIAIATCKTWSRTVGVWHNHPAAAERPWQVGKEMLTESSIFLKSPQTF